MGYVEIRRIDYIGFSAMNKVFADEGGSRLNQAQTNLEYSTNEAASRFDWCAVSNHLPHTNRSTTLPDRLLEG